MQKRLHSVGNWGKSYLLDLLGIDLGIGEVADEAEDSLIESIVG